MPAPIPNPALAPALLLEDARVLVASKPAGVVTEPGLGHRDDSLMNGLFARFGDLARLGEERDYGLLHRLDRDTSGAVMVARDAAAYDALRRQFERRTVAKKYLALVEGRPRPANGQVALPLEEVRRGDMKVAVVGRGGRGEPALTRYRTLGSGHGRTLLEIDLDTGRLHQIRAHMALAGCPVVNDRVYRVDEPPNTSMPPRGRPQPPLALHAWSVAFDHPATGARTVVAAPLPESFTALLRQASIPSPSDASAR
ncbi:MAG: RluA family pseudouridine synthase [Phycisphaerales bacterium]